MKVLVSVDMEGITGVTGPQDAQPGTSGWERFRPFMTRDTNAAVAGAFLGGAADVVVTEAHHGHRNVLLERLDDRASMITGRHKRFAMLEGIDRGIDLVLFVGYHGPSGSAGVLSHTFFASALLELRLNGERCSEGRFNAALAGSYGVGVGIICGDDVACADGVQFIPGIRPVVVKEAYDRFTARCLPPARTEELIRDAAAAATASPSSHPPLLVEPPFVWEADWVGTHSARAGSFAPGVERIGPNTLRWECPDMPTSSDMWKTVGALVSGAIEDHFV